MSCVHRSLQSIFTSMCIFTGIGVGMCIGMHSFICVLEPEAFRGHNLAAYSPPNVVLWLWPSGGAPVCRAITYSCCMDSYYIYMEYRGMVCQSQCTVLGHCANIREAQVFCTQVSLCVSICRHRCIYPCKSVSGHVHMCCIVRHLGHSVRKF